METAPTSDPAAARPLPSTSSHPPKSFLRPNPNPNPNPNPTPNPPLFAPPTLLGKPINPLSQGGTGTGTGTLYHHVGPTASAAHRGFPPRPADRTVTVANPAGYIRNTSPTAVMTFAPPSQPRPFLFASAAAATADPPLPPIHSMRPPPPLPPHSHHFVIPRQPPLAGTLPKNVPKVGPCPSITLAPENNSNDRDKSREDTVVMIHDRKVRLSEGGSGSIYALCRSWLRNGLPQESQPNIGDSFKALPKPLPASISDSQILKKHEDTNEAEDNDKEEDLGPIEQLSAHDLLKAHVRHAKRIRSRLKKERLTRIDRYKQRLSLLIPTQNEWVGRNDASSGR